MTCAIVCTRYIWQSNFDKFQWKCSIVTGFSFHAWIVTNGKYTWSKSRNDLVWHFREAMSNVVKHALELMSCHLLAYLWSAFDYFVTSKSDTSMLLKRSLVQFHIKIPTRVITHSDWMLQVMWRAFTKSALFQRRDCLHIL